MPTTFADTFDVSDGRPGISVCSLGRPKVDVPAAIVPVASLEDDNFGVGFRKGDAALRDKVESLLKEMAADGTVAEISTKWFGADISTIPVG